MSLRGFWKATDTFIKSMNKWDLSTFKTKINSSWLSWISGGLYSLHHIISIKAKSFQQLLDHTDFQHSEFSRNCIPESYLTFFFGNTAMLLSLCFGILCKQPFWKISFSFFNTPFTLRTNLPFLLDNVCAFKALLVITNVLFQHCVYFAIPKRKRR